MIPASWWTRWTARRACTPPATAIKSSDAERIAYLLENLKDVPAERRTAKFVCVITCLWPDGRRIVARGECPGQILFAPKGTGGFGYDPVFYLPELEKTYAELAPEEKKRHFPPCAGASGILQNLSGGI